MVDEADVRVGIEVAGEDGMDEEVGGVAQGRRLSISDDALPRGRRCSLAWRGVGKEVEVMGGPADSQGEGGASPPAGAGWKAVLVGVSGRADPGEMVAIMGPSGAGKTSLLSVLAKGGQTSGEVWLAGRRRVKSDKRRMGYVAQDDVFFGSLTARETLETVAELRMPEEVGAEAKAARVEDVMEAMGIAGQAETRVGQPGGPRGLSGGERKRVNVACELVSDPAVLLLDEPTSGLDSTTALRLILALKRLAGVGQRTVVLSIHQPSSAMFFAFDRLVLLAGGRCIFSGRPRDAVEYAGALGLPCPPLVNAADFLMDLASGDPFDEHASELREFLALSYRRAASRAGGDPADLRMDAASAEGGPSWKEFAADPWGVGATMEAEIDSAGAAATARGAVAVAVTAETKGEVVGASEALSDGPKYPCSWSHQFVTLARRSLLERRGDAFSKEKLIEVFGIALITGVVWLNTGFDAEGVYKRAGLVFFCAVFWGFFPLFNALFTFPGELTVISKERSAGLFHLSAYYMARLATDIPMELCLPLVWSTIVYWMAALNPKASSFFAFVGVILLQVLASQGLGVFLSAAVKNVAQASTIASIFMLTTMLVAGFFVENDDMPPWITWLKYLSFNSYSYSQLMQIEFDGSRTYPCSTAELQTSGMQCPQTADVILDAYGISSPVSVNLGALSAMVVCARIGGYLALKYLHRPE